MITRDKGGGSLTMKGQPGGGAILTFGRRRKDQAPVTGGHPPLLPSCWTERGSGKFKRREKMSNAVSQLDLMEAERKSHQ